MLLRQVRTQFSENSPMPPLYLHPTPARVATEGRITPSAVAIIFGISEEDARRICVIDNGGIYLRNRSDTNRRDAYDIGIEYDRTGVPYQALDNCRRPINQQLYFLVTREYILIYPSLLAEVRAGLLRIKSLVIIRLGRHRMIRPLYHFLVALSASDNNHVTNYVDN